MFLSKTAIYKTIGQYWVWTSFFLLLGFKNILCFSTSTVSWYISQSVIHEKSVTFLTEAHRHTDKLEVVYCSLWTGPEQGEWYAVKKAFVSPTVIMKHQSTGTGRGGSVYQCLCKYKTIQSLSSETGFCVECGKICMSLCELMYMK